MSWDDSKLKRKTLPKSLRLKVLSKTNGRCGYCGVELAKFCIDHIVPLARTDGTNDESNLMAACFQCNSYKITYSVEQFRREIGKQIERMKAYSVNARMAFKFGLVEETNKPVVFYFEEIRKVAR